MSCHESEFGYVGTQSDFSSVSESEFGFVCPLKMSFVMFVHESEFVYVCLVLGAFLFVSMAVFACVMFTWKQWSWLLLFAP